MTTFDLDFFFDDSQRNGPIKVKAYEAKCSVALPKSNLPGLDMALNPYVGCEHGCLYCFAPDIVKRPRGTWATEVGYRSNIPVLLNRELRKKRGTIGIGTVTDPYQPLEKVLLLTRKCLLEIVRHDNPISVQTKSDLVLRDLDLITSSARPEVGITITTADESLALKVEPGAPSPSKRLEALAKISQEGVNCYAMIGPVLPFVDEEELTATLEAIGSTGCKRVMVDRLRMRPGLEEAFLESKVIRTTGCLTDMVRMGSLSRYVRDECVRMGLKFEAAF
jgi:DNA repair photolyase